MRKVFLDCGANNGQSVDWFKKEYNRDDFEVHSFEPNPVLAKNVKSKGVIFHPEAVWIENGEMELIIGKSSLNSTLMPEKFSGKTETKIKVKTIDFSVWIQDTFSENDYIILKMDIEGAEYKVLEKMLEDKTFDWINVIYVEFHGNKMSPRLTDKNENIIKRITKQRTQFNYWSG